MTPRQDGTPPSSQALQDTVSWLVASILGKNQKSVGPDDPLFATHHGFDSYSLMEFVLQLEDTFGLSIPDEDLDLDIFHSVKTIIAYLKARLEKMD